MSMKIQNVGHGMEIFICESYPQIQCGESEEEISNHKYPEYPWILVITIKIHLRKYVCCIRLSLFLMENQ